jgi:hypothetical protein
MKILSLSCQLEFSRRSNAFQAFRSPLPPQGEGEGEGLFEAIRVEIFETPHLSPLPFSEGRGRKKQVLLGANRGSQNKAEDGLGYPTCQSTNVRE